MINGKLLRKSHAEVKEHAILIQWIVDWSRAFKTLNDIQLELAATILITVCKTVKAEIWCYHRLPYLNHQTNCLASLQNELLPIIWKNAERAQKLKGEVRFFIHVTVILAIHWSLLSVDCITWSQQIYDLSHAQHVLSIIIVMRNFASLNCVWNSKNQREAVALADRFRTLGLRML
jgi:hypothetical protein